MRRSYANKIDANQPEIVDALRKAGCLVKPMNMVGDGFPDLLVCWAGVTTMLEVKDPSQPPSKRALTPDQRIFHAIWAEARLAVVTTPEEALFAARACTGEPLTTDPRYRVKETK